MAAHQITINPLSGGIGTAPAGVVPYASDTWGVDAVRMPQAGTPSVNAQAKLSPAGMARQPVSGTLTVRFTGKISPSATVRGPQLGNTTVSFSLAIVAGSCPPRSMFGNVRVASRRDVAISGMGECLARLGEADFVSIASVAPGGCTREAAAFGLPSLQTAADLLAHAVEQRSSWGSPLVAFGWDAGPESISTVLGMGRPGLSHHVDVYAQGAGTPPVMGPVLLVTKVQVETPAIEKRTLTGLPDILTLVEILPPGMVSRCVTGPVIEVKSTALALPAGILTVPAVPPLFEVRTETYLVTLLRGVANMQEEVRGIAVYTATATPVQGIIIPTTRLEGILNIIIPITGTTRSIM